MIRESLALLAPLITVVFFFNVLPAVDAARPRFRVFVSLVIVALGVRYMIWRVLDTVIPAEGSAFQIGWIWFCFAVELLAMLEMIIFIITLSRWSDRRAEAAAAAAALAEIPRENWPFVDIFIPTLNEGVEVIERTLIGARSLDYPNYRVWVLDDGKRPWLADLCLRKGVGYLTRGERTHAKAGNLNVALDRTAGDFIAILDADFVPRYDFLSQTVGFFADRRIGIVQTPQHFFNRDPIQTNLRLHEVWPDEQRLFFDVIAPARDAWDAAFCCGSCSVLRRSALEEIGGFPTPSVTEDLLTSLAMLRRGYITRYLNERLSAGLAPESTDAFFIQRQRWARGAIQSIFLKEGPLGPGLTLWQRLLFFPFSWITQYPVRLLALVVPTVYLWTGLTPLAYTPISDLFNFQVPMLLAFMAGMRWFAPRHYLPLLSTSTGVFITFRLLPTIAGSLIRPFGEAFRVTPKGNLIDRRSMDHKTFLLTFVFMAATIGGLAINTVPDWQPLDRTAFFPVAAAWSFFNLVVLFIAALICIETPDENGESHFVSGEGARYRRGGTEMEAWLIALTVDGAHLDVRALDDTAIPELPSPGERITVVVSGVGDVSAIVADTERLSIRVVFHPIEEGTREKLILKLYAGHHAMGVENLQLAGVIWALIGRLFGVSRRRSSRAANIMFPGGPPIFAEEAAEDTTDYVALHFGDGSSKPAAPKVVPGE